MIALLLADGFEEIEALTPLDLLRRVGADVKTVSIFERTVIGAHGIPIVADCIASEVDPEEFEHLILPGGMPGTSNLDISDFTDRAIDSVIRKDGRIAAICAAPLILGRRGLLDGKRAVCYPGFEKELRGAFIPADETVVTDGLITTARGMGVALKFAKEVVRLFCKKTDAEIERLSASVMEEKNS